MTSLPYRSIWTPLKGAQQALDGRHADVRDGQGDDEEGPVSQEFPGRKLDRTLLTSRKANIGRMLVALFDIVKYKKQTFLDCQLHIMFVISYIIIVTE